MSTGLGREDIRALLDDLSAELVTTGGTQGREPSSSPSEALPWPWHMTPRGRPATSRRCSFPPAQSGKRQQR